MIAAILLQLAAIGTVDPHATESTQALAARTFAVVPAGIVSHEIRVDPLIRQPYAIDFFGSADPFGAGLCRRKVYYVSATQVGSRSAPTMEKAQLALADDCAAIASAQFAWVQPTDALNDAAITLRWLADKQRRGDAAAVTCLPSPYKPDPCTNGAAAALRALPLDHIYIINKGHQPGEWALSAMPTGPGQLFYDVRLSRDRNGAAAVTIQWTAPAPF